MHGFNIEMGTCTFVSPSHSFLPSQLSQAFSIVYDSGLNEYALYMDCEGGVGARAYKRSMSHLFRNYRKHWDTFQVSAPLWRNTVFKSILALDFVSLVF